MRLIDQKRTADIPYELFALALEKCEKGFVIRAYNQNLGSAGLGIYKSKKKALKVMKALKQEYIEYGSNGYFEFPKNEEV